MKKYHGKQNKGFTRANVARSVRAIEKAVAAGRSPKTDRRLAEMYDYTYGTDFVAAYHAEK